MREYTFVDLFAGAGGFTEGLLLARTAEAAFRLVAAADLSPFAKLTHEHRFRHQLATNYTFLQGDIAGRGFSESLTRAIRDVTNSTSVDVVVGGPPCQGFSVFGLRKESDPRNNLFLAYLKIIGVLRPRYFVMENVPGMATMYGGKTIERMHDEVGKMRPTRYNLTGPIKVRALDFGVPQIRERILFVGCRADVSAIRDIPPTASAPVAVHDAIGDLAFLRPWESNGRYHEPALTKYQRDSRRGRLYAMLGLAPNGDQLHNHDAARHTPEVIARFAMMRPGKGLDSIPTGLWDAHLRSSKKWCVRLDPQKPSYTVTTLPDDLVHYEQHRILTVREAARLQSFDDTFQFLGPRSTGGGGKGNKKRNQELPQYSQVGNAVPPLLAQGIGFALLRALGAAS